MNKVLEALKGVLPEDKLNTVSAAIDQMIEEAKTQLEAEYNKNLQEAYANLAAELKQSEETGIDGYKEAYAMIKDLKLRLEQNNAEWKAAMDEGYEEAYQMLVEERGKNEKFELEVYEEYDKKLNDMKTYMVEKVDEFLSYKAKVMAEAARREALNDPQIAEHKVALDHVVEILSDYISDEDYALATSSKLGEALSTLEELRNKQRMLEARNINLSRENKKLNEQVRVFGASLNESKKTVVTETRKAREEKAKNVTGRGKKETEQVEVIAEHNNDKVSTKKVDDKETSKLMESFDDLAATRVLAGIRD
jgi:hypothetical protein